MEGRKIKRKGGREKEREEGRKIKEGRTEGRKEEKKKGGGGGR